jgi:DNA-binding transcriptional regulator/RsmH inhibitor MraZ
MARIEDMDDGESERELLEYLYFVKCDEVGVDETGRFVLPPAAREKLGLDGEACSRARAGNSTSSSRMMVQLPMTEY